MNDLVASLYDLSRWYHLSIGKNVLNENSAIGMRALNISIADVDVYVKCVLF